MTQDRSVSPFPMRAVIIGVIAMVAIALASAASTWVVGERIRTITSSQISVLMASERLQHQSELLELSARMAIATGDEAYARRYGAIQPELRRFPKARDLAILTAVAVAENFGYRQLANFWRLRGWWQFLRKQQGWGTMTRKGFAKT